MNVFFFFFPGEGKLFQINEMHETCKKMMLCIEFHRILLKCWLFVVKFDA
jgi:hypothetical protein